MVQTDLTELYNTNTLTSNIFTTALETIIIVILVLEVGFEFCILKGIGAKKPQIVQLPKTSMGVYSSENLNFGPLT